jgi:hypothetical protein
MCGSSAAKTLRLLILVDSKNSPEIKLQLRAMDTIQRLRMSQRIIATATKPSLNTVFCPAPIRSLPRFRLSVRHASTTAPPKTIVLEQPDKFRPPSHPQRLNRRAPRQYPGPPLSEAERKAQKTKRYPHMFPNEGTFMHWFLTNRWLHLFITVVRTFILGLFRPAL